MPIWIPVLCPQLACPFVSSWPLSPHSPATCLLIYATHPWSPHLSTTWPHHCHCMLSIPSFNYSPPTCSSVPHGLHLLTYATPAHLYPTSSVPLTPMSPHPPTAHLLIHPLPHLPTACLVIYAPHTSTVPLVHPWDTCDTVTPKLNAITRKLPFSKLVS